MNTRVLVAILFPIALYACSQSSTESTCPDAGMYGAGGFVTGANSSSSAASSSSSVASSSSNGSASSTASSASSASSSGSCPSSSSSSTSSSSSSTSGAATICGHAVQPEYDNIPPTCKFYDGQFGQEMCNVDPTTPQVLIQCTQPTQNPGGCSYVGIIGTDKFYCCNPWLCITTAANTPGATCPPGKTRISCGPDPEPVPAGCTFLEESGFNAQKWYRYCCNCQ